VNGAPDLKAVPLINQSAVAIDQRSRAGQVTLPTHDHLRILDPVVEQASIASRSCC